MIDTDKYEGHTKGPWRYVDFTNCPKGSKHSYIMSDTGKVFRNLTGSRWPDELLIADAPLLLQEVKRLQKFEKAWKALHEEVTQSCICFVEYPDKQDENTHGLMNSIMEKVIE